MLNTPIKNEGDNVACESHDQMLTTPINCNSSDVDNLLGDFTGLKINGGGLKRNIERSTIEGTPINVKRPDLNPTPLFKSSNLVSGSRNSTADTFDGSVLIMCSASNEHNTKDHQENALRTALLCGEDGCLKRQELSGALHWIDSDNFEAAVVSDLLRVHEYQYLRHLETKACPESKDQLPNFYAPVGFLDSDTPLLQQSLNAAKRYCGAAIKAVDYLLLSKRGLHVTRSSDSNNSNSNNTIPENISRIFVIGRPPGHHAGPNGCVTSEYFWQRPDMTSSGFCLFNTVAVAAAYARYNYGRNFIANSSKTNNDSDTSKSHSNNNTLKIAIIDIDIHHGNGTEEIVRNLKPRTTYLPLPSSWAPIATMSYKPWLNEQDADDVFLSSIHLYAGSKFYPCSGNEVSNKNDENILNIELTPIGPGPWDQKGRIKLTHNQREELCRKASEEFRHKVNTMLLPRLHQFQPNLIFISAGFDAHYDDMYHFLTEHDIHWITEQLCNINDIYHGYGVISILEGGYSLSSTIPIPTAAANTRTKAANKNNIANNNTMNTATYVGASTIIDENSATTAAGRPARNKSKKVLDSPDHGTTSLNPTIIKSNSSSNQKVGSVSNSGNSKINETTVDVIIDQQQQQNDNQGSNSTPVVAMNPYTMFAQKQGDGGLVKSVLAHVAALAGVKSWSV